MNPYKQKKIIETINDFTADVICLQEVFEDSLKQDIIDEFAASHRDLEVEEARVLAFRTDEGLMAPYGIADLDIVIVYEVNV